MNNLETDVDELGIKEFQKFFFFLKKLSDVADNDVVEKTVSIKLN